MTWPLDKKLVAGIGLALAMLVAIGVFQHRTIQALVEADRLVTHTDAVLNELEGAFSAIQDVESRGRGYVAMGEERFAGQFEVSILDAQGHLQRLRKLTADNPRQQRYLRRLEPLAKRKIDFMLQLIVMRRDRGLAAAQKLLGGGEGLRVMDEIRSLVDAMTAEENALLQGRQAASLAAARAASSVSSAGTTVALGLLLWASWIIQKDATRRRLAEESLHRANAYNRSLIEASLDPLVTIAPDGKITDVNSATETVTGFSRQELVGADFSDYFTEPDRARAGYQQVFREGRVQNYELSIRHRDGHLTPVTYNASVYRDEAGVIVGVFAAARDLTERKRAEEDVRTLNAELEHRVRQRTAELQAANNELDSFSYSVSHDLRSPLRAMDGFTRILLEEHRPNLAPEAQRYLEIIRNSAVHMGSLIDGLLAFARLGRQDLNRRTVAMDSLARQAIEDLGGERAGRQVELIVGNLPSCAGDPVLLRQVFVNLLSNALKYTRPRELARIEIGSLRLEEMGASSRSVADAGTAVYYVRDNGVGFDSRYRHKLFGVFQRLHRQEDFEGTGVGLATVQRIIHKHEGTVWAEGELDQGATFYFTVGGSC